MGDETIKLSAKTWARAVNSIHKIRYSDGMVDGESKAFQSSFDMGYEEGFRYGLKMGFVNAIDPPRLNTASSENANCIICSDSNKLKDNVINLYNLQKEKNNEAFL
ncbi:uncharacterized protein LOC119828423 [Zerene cesonia]|uniref:uncharacterized protein LOC119828423 n=1 Tax=Zerene cesonia TaxID=33412 RepID=UPI0018E52867|nr:uncharacterized protein LOC119828423 [Zerene cesonia]